MSLIVLKSTAGELPFNFQNNFREALTLTPNTQVQLVNMAINKDKEFTIVLGENDRYTYRLGPQTGNQFFNKLVVVPAGVYSPGALAAIMERNMNIKNQLKNFTFSMSYTEDDNFKLGWSQTDLPSAGGADYAINALVNDESAVVEHANHTTITPPDRGGVATDNHLLNQLYICEKGIFPDGGQISCVIQPLNAGGYGRVALGLSRVLMAFPDQFGQDGTNPNTSVHLASTTNLVCDYQIELFDDATPATTTQVRVRQLTQQPGTNYPNPNWFNMNTKRGPQNITTALPTLNSGTDHIRLTITLSQVRNLTFSIAHDTAGDGTFINNTQFAQTGTAGFNSTMKEVFFPFVPVIAFNDGATANPAKELTLFGNYVDDNDGTEVRATHLDQETKNAALADTIANDATLQGNLFTSHTLPFVRSGTNKNYGSDDTLGLGLTAGTMQPVQYFQFGPVVEGQFVSGGGTIPDNQDPANATGGSPADRLIPNIANTLGLENVVYAAANSGVNGEVQSTDTPEETILSQGLVVELPDFNIKGYNGETGDVLPTISVFQKEDPEDGTTDGTLTYTPKYPLPLSLNMPMVQNINTIRVRIRSDDGTLATFLKPSTTMCLYFTEKGDSDKNMIVERIEEMLKKQAESEQNQIAQINSETRVI